MLPPPEVGNGVVVWRADFETGDLSQWTAVQAKDDSRIAVVSRADGAPVLEGRYAGRFEVLPGDSNVAGSGSNGERSDVYASQKDTGGYEGQEQWWSWWTYFPQGFEPSSSDWNVFTGFHHTGLPGQESVGQVPITFEIHARTASPPAIFLRANESETEQGSRSYRLAPLITGHWYHFVFHVRWSSDRRRGFIEVWVDGKRVVPKTFRRTLYPGQGVYLKQGFYRANCDCTSVVYIDGTKRFVPRQKR